MIVLDANILLYAYHEESARHARARAFLEDIFSGSELIGLPWQCVIAFLRITTNPAFPGKRLHQQEAVEIVETWMEQPRVVLLAPEERHWPLLRSAILGGQASGTLVSDAHLAALTIEHGGVLYTSDRDFTRFPGLRWKNPLSD